MNEKRTEIRLLCSNMVELEWTSEENGDLRTLLVNLEDISGQGACVQSDEPVPPSAQTSIRYGAGSLSGTVRYCVFDTAGWLIGIEFHPDSRWSPDGFEPEHLIDPSTVGQERRSPGRPRSSTRRCRRAHRSLSS